MPQRCWVTLTPRCLLRRRIAALAPRGRSSTGWRCRAACRPRPTGARARGRTRRRPRGRGCRRGSTRSGARRATRRVLSRLLPPARRPSACEIAERDVVADDRERGRRHLEHGRAAGPTARRVRRPASPSSSSNDAGVGEAHLDAVHDRALVAVEQISRRRAVLGRRARRGASPTRPRSGMSRVPSAALTVRISSPSTVPTARAWEIWWPRTTSVMRDVHDRRRPGVREVLAGRPDERPAGRPAPAPRSQAPRPQPPKSAPRPEHSCGTTGSSHVFASPERVRPKNERASTGSM